MSSDDDRRLLRGLRFIAELPQQNSPTLQDSFGQTPGSVATGEGVGTAAADALQMPLGTVKTMMRRGLIQVRQLMGVDVTSDEARS